MVQILPQEGNLGSNFGAAFGSGLSEQLPKEAQRYRLSKGLRDLGQNVGNQTPLEQSADLLGIPGMTPELAAHYLPLLQQQQARQATQGSMGGRVAPVGQGQPPSQGQQPSNQPSEMTSRRGGSNYLLPSSPEDIDQKIAQYVQDPRYLGKSTDELRALAMAEDSRRVEGDRALEQRIDLGNARYDSRLNEKQVSNLGDYNTVFRDEVADRIERGESPNDAANAVSAKALAFDRARNNLDSLTNKSFFSRDAKTSVQKLNNIREEYKKAGALYMLADDLVDKENMSYPRANALTFPIYDNKKLNSFIKSQPDFDLKVAEKKGHTKFAPNENVSDFSSIVSGPQEKSRELARKAVPYITENDSPGSISVAFGKKGYDEAAVMDELNRAYVDGKLSLTQRQAEEFQKTNSWYPKLGDMFFYSMLGEEV